MCSNFFLFFEENIRFGDSMRLLVGKSAVVGEATRPLGEAPKVQGGKYF
jgi:hypothetical protein